MKFSLTDLGSGIHAEQHSLSLSCVTEVATVEVVSTVLDNFSAA